MITVSIGIDRIDTARFLLSLSAGTISMISVDRLQ